MSWKGKGPEKAFLEAVKGAGSTTLLSILLLFPAAFGIYSGRISASAGCYVVSAALFVSAFITRWIVNGADKGRGIQIILINVFLFGILLLFSAAFPGGTIDPAETALRTLCAAVGCALGDLTKINKKYTWKRKRLKKYNR